MCGLGAGHRDAGRQGARRARHCHRPPPRTPPPPHAAQSQGYVARSAYKLLEIQDKHKLIPQGGTVLDLG